MNPGPSRASAVVVSVFGALCLYFTGVFPPLGNANEVSRLEAVYAFVEKGTFAIDEVTPILGDHEDKSAAGGRFYSNKAPGMVLAAIPVYRLLRVILPAPTRPTDFIFVLLRILLVSSVCCIALARFFARLSPRPSAALAGFALVFGTPFLFYARSFFSHAWTASLLFLAWDLVKRAEENEHVRRVSALALGAGFLAMWAVISEYPLAPIGLLLAIRSLSRRSGKRFLLFAAGAAPPLVLLGIYNAACFGSPFVLSSAREAGPLYASLGAQSSFGFGPPSLAIAWRYLFDPARGALLFSPFLIWIPVGFWNWWKSGLDRADALFAGASTAVYFALMTGYANWHGGWTLGDRYLLPVVFLAGLALVHALETPLSRTCFLAAAAYSVAAHFFLTASFPHLIPSLRWPVGNAAGWFLARGWIAPNGLGRLGLWSLLPPVAATLAAGFAAARPLLLARPTRAVIPAALAGLALAIGMLFVQPEIDFSARLWRAGVFGSSSGRDPGRTELIGVVASARSPLERRQAVGAWRSYGKGPLDLRRR